MTYHSTHKNYTTHFTLMVNALFISLLFSHYSYANNKDAQSHFDSIYNLSQVSPTFYAAGQPSIEALSEFKARGIDVVINLRPSNEMDDTEEQAQLEQQNIAYHQVAVNGAKGLTYDSVKALDDILKGLDKDQTVMIHCASSNRVGAMMALRANWLQGKTPDESMDIGRQYGMKSLSSSVQAQLK